MFLTKKFYLLLTLMLFSILLSSCGLSPEELVATSAAETAEAATNTPSPTSTSPPTSTPKPTPTPTKIPSLSEEELIYANAFTNLATIYHREWVNVYKLILLYSEDTSLLNNVQWLSELAAALNIVYETDQSISQLSAPDRFVEVHDLLGEVSSNNSFATMMLSGLVSDRLDQTIIMPGWTPEMIWYAVDLIDSSLSTIYSGQENLERTIHNMLGISTVNISMDEAFDGRGRWSPDGSRIAFASDRSGNPDIYIMQSDGSNPNQLTNHPSDDSYPDWSPEGDNIVFASNRDGNFEIYKVSVTGSEIERLTQHPSMDYLPAWSNDGSQIAFASERDGYAEIYIMNADGTDIVNVTKNQSGDISPAWSPTDRILAFTSIRSGQDDIYTLDLGSTSLVNVSNHPEADSSPAWSPDGERLAFVSFRDGNPEIYIMNVDGTEVMRLTYHFADDYLPDWSPDGKNILFHTTRDINGEVYSIGPLPQ